MQLFFLPNFFYIFNTMCNCTELTGTFFDGCKRELKEELGLTATEENTRLVAMMQKPNRFRAVWLVRTEASLSDLSLQKEEVADAKWATPEMIRELVKTGEFWEYDYLDWLFEKIDQVRSENWVQNKKQEDVYVPESIKKS